ncbi:hypothetical protein Tco_1181081 [Tanacetum coccineum]
MEVLTLMLHRWVRDSNSFSYHRYCDKLALINLCFADDLFLFSHGDADSAQVIMETLDEFKLVSGLTPSLPKSTAYFCNVLNHTKLELIEKVPNHIMDWKNNFLSTTVFILPSRILLDIEQLMRGFLWCQGDMRKGKAKVAWEFIWYRIGDGSTASVWFNRWCPISPLSNIVSLSDIYRAGFDMSSNFKDIIANDNWMWPPEWPVKYPPLLTIIVPTINLNVTDMLEWRDMSGKLLNYSVATVWDCIRPKGDEANWYDVVWFSKCIPPHAFHLWPVIKRKLKTKENLRQWDISSNTNVWNQVKIYAGLPNVSSSLNAITDHIIPMSKKKNARSVIAKLVFAASTYFIWQERNNRLFKSQKRSHSQIIECIISTVRLKLLTCKFKRTKNMMSFTHLWKLPDSLLLAPP